MQMIHYTCSPLSKSCIHRRRSACYLQGFLYHQANTLTHIESARPDGPLALAQLSFALSKLSRYTCTCVLVLRYSPSNNNFYYQNDFVRALYVLGLCSPYRSMIPTCSTGFQSDPCFAPPVPSNRGYIPLQCDNSGVKSHKGHLPYSASTELHIPTTRPHNHSTFLRRPTPKTHCHNISHTRKFLAPIAILPALRFFILQDLSPALHTVAAVTHTLDTVFTNSNELVLGVWILKLVYALVPALQGTSNFLPRDPQASCKFNCWPLCNRVVDRQCQHQFTALLLCTCYWSGLSGRMPHPRGPSQEGVPTWLVFSVLGDTKGLARRDYGRQIARWLRRSQDTSTREDGRD